jgi:glyceraldehyde 3-phosphate dehydrogenase
MRVAVNGFGRIGKAFLRAVLSDEVAKKKVDIVAINSGPGATDIVAHLVKYDSLMGTYPGDVSSQDSTLYIDDKKIQLVAQCDPTQLPWKELAIDWVVDCSGRFTHRAIAQKHRYAGAKKVLISAPAHDEDIAIIPGVNDNLFDPHKHAIVSLGSCTTNACMPLLKVLREECSLKRACITTVHAYTNSQSLLDSDGKDLRFARAAGLNIIPTSTGASSMIGKIIPELADAIEVSSIRVPVAKVSLLDVTFIADKSLTVEMINTAFRHASKTTLNRILAITDQQLVSTDFYNNPYSVVIDASLTKAMGSMGKVFGWYDNEWAYSLRMKDFLLSL